MAWLKHPRDTVGDYQKRFLIHIFIGLLIGIPILGEPVRKLFVKYEENEDLHTRDEAWKDYSGAIAGAVVIELTILALLIWGIVKIISEV